MKKSRLNHANALRFLHSMFEEKPTFQFAREIWLMCQRHNLDVPHDVMTLFVEGTQKRHDAYSRNQADSQEKQSQIIKSKMVLVRYVEYLTKNGKTQADAFYRYKEKMNSKDSSYYEKRGQKKKKLTVEAVQKKYDRFQKIKHMYVWPGI